MAYSYKLCIRKDRAKKNGYASLYIHIKIDSEPTTEPLNLKWPVDFFDIEVGKILKREKKDKDYDDYNMIINTALSKINEIFKWYRLADKKLTMELFRREMSHFTSKTDFIAYFETKLNDRYRYGEIVLQTYKNHLAVLRKLKEFRPKLLFADLTVELLQKYRFHLKEVHENKKNTIWGNFKDIKTYFHLAQESGIKVPDPFKEFKTQSEDGARVHLSQKELMLLFEFYFDQRTAPEEKKVLKYFLFSCCGGGLRISDLMRSSREALVGETLVFQPYKGSSKKRNTKLLYIPLNEIALKFIKDAWQESESSNLFDTFTEQGSNRILKQIAEKVGINKKMTNHVARHTFATLYLELGGNVEVLQQILGHSKIQTTMIYVHVTSARKKEQMHAFNTIPFNLQEKV